MSGLNPLRRIISTTSLSLGFADHRFKVVPQIRPNSLPFSTMSYITPTSIQAPTLREWVLSKQPNPQSKETESSSSSSSSIPKTFKIVDVRDDDYVGGHIPGALNIPSRQFPSRVDSLVDELKDNEAVVFTCALSQQRGPNVFSLKI
jgi:rhodanese-related sulfurtransferase